MNETIFLAQYWGPVLVAVGVGFFMSRQFYIRTYRNLENETLALLIFGILGVVGGIAHIQLHNTWETFPQIIISIFGWGLLIKGLMFIIVPHIVDRLADWEADLRLIPIAGVVLVILGGYLSWIGYM